MVAEVAYFAYTVQQQTSDGFQQQLGLLQSKVDALQKIKTEDDHWRAQLKSAQDNLQNTSKPSAPGMPTPTTSYATSGGPANAASVDSSDTNPAAHASTSPMDALGTITTLQGKTYLNCQLLKVEPDGITFNHSEGIAKVLFVYLSPDIQKRFGFDPEKTAAMEEAEAKYREQLRQASENAGTTTPPTTQ
jgi:hypothetical protein